MRGGGLRLVLLMAVCAALSGCGAIIGTVGGGGGGGGGVSSSGCTNISGGACQEQVDRLAARHPGAKDISITCTVPVCDRDGGSGTAVITMPDGSTINDTFSYAGVQGGAPMPAPTCKRIALDLCKRIADQMVEMAASSRRIVAMDVTCDAMPCTDAKGETTVIITYADGSKETTGMGWEGGAP